MKWDVLLKVLPFAVPLAGVLLKYFLDRFDGVRKEQHGVKGLAFVCWYGPYRGPLRWPRWTVRVASRLRGMVPGGSDAQFSQRTTANTRKATAFIFNSGRVPLKAEDLFANEPLKMMVSGDGQLLNVKIRSESDQVAGFKLIERRAYFFRPRKFLTERALTFTYLAPGHGVVLDIEYTSDEPVTFKLSGPVDGMKHSVQEKTLFSIDINKPGRVAQQRRTAIRKVWTGLVLMAMASLEFLHHVPSNHGHFTSTKDSYYWGALIIFMIGEWLTLTAWDVVKQPRKIPAALRYWDTAKDNRSTSHVSSSSDSGVSSSKRPSVPQPMAGVQMSPVNTLIAARQDRYLSFQRFHNAAKAAFQDLYSDDARAVEMGHLYSFLVVPGGSSGGNDQRLVEVFFGSRAVGTANTLMPTSHGWPRVAPKTLTEAGARLHYTRTDAGTVVVSLHPAATESLKQREDFIILGWIRNPRALALGRIRRCHWRAFMSYMHCTSIDGMPTLMDRIRIARIRFTSIMVTNGTAEGRRVVTASAILARYVLTIGLSGFLLSAITLWQSTGEEAASRSEHDSIIHDLAGAKATIESQSKEIQSLERRVDVLRPTNAAKGPLFSSSISVGAGTHASQ